MRALHVSANLQKIIRVWHTSRTRLHSQASWTTTPRSSLSSSWLFVLPASADHCTGSQVVAYFTAQWCGPCRRLSPEYEKLAAQYPVVKFVKVDVDEAQVRLLVLLLVLSALLPVINRLWQRCMKLPRCQRSFSSTTAYVLVSRWVPTCQLSPHKLRSCSSKTNPHHGYDTQT